MNSLTFFTNMALLSGVNNAIYAEDTSNLSKILLKIIKLVGGIGGLCFTLAVLIIALVIIFGSISPRNVGKWWTALFSCVAGAGLFFTAYLLKDVIAGLAS